MERLVTDMYTFKGKVEDCENDYIIAVQEKLRHYEDLAEQGRLIELPCKIGDSIYQPIRNIVNEYKVIGLCYDITKKEWILEVIYQLGLKWTKTLCSFDAIGKTVFLTKSEAEAKLKELEGEENG